MGKMIAVRGATRLKQDDQWEMVDAIGELYRELLAKNMTKERKIITIIFTQTDDIKTANPATALRANGNISLPLLCAQEPHYSASLPMTVRMLMIYYGSKRAMRPVYLRGTECLRPDLH